MMKSCLSALVLVLVGAAYTPRLQAQAAATATGNTLSVGLSYQNINPDYGPVRASGVGLFVNYDFSRYIGATAEVNLQTALSSVVFPERTYMVGARGEYRSGPYMVYAKALVGGASSSNNSDNPYLLNVGSYPLYAYGGGLEIRLEHHITLRAIDFEQQQWLEYHPNGLTPGLLSFGVAYRLQ